MSSSPGRLEEALILNKVDLGITYEPIPRPGIDYVKVKTLQMAYALRGRFRETSVHEIPFVVPVSPKAHPRESKDETVGLTKSSNAITTESI